MNNIFIEQKIDTFINYEFRDLQLKQKNIFDQLESTFSFYNGEQFKNQVHFQSANQTPVQRWFSYREGYSIELVKNFIREFDIKGNIFDPFSGSGTTLMASRLSGIRSFGVEINPLSFLISKVENEQYTSTDISGIEKVFKELGKLEKSRQDFHINFDLANKIFNMEILRSLMQFKQFIENINNEKVKNILFLTWLSIIENVSNIKKEGNGIKYKNRKRTPNGYLDIEKEKWENERFPKDKFSFVKSKILERLEIILFDLKFQYGKCDKKPNIFHGSCLDFPEFFSDNIELTFFSPPYCNCFDYFEIHKVELWMGDFVSEKEEFRKLRNASFRSNTNSLGSKPTIYQNKYLEDLIMLLDRDNLWNSKIPEVIRGYFDDTYILLKKLYQQTSIGGHIGIVVGNSAYSNVIIPTDSLIAEIGQEIGFKIKNIFITRHLTTSSQQKINLTYLKNYLRESIILLER